MHLKNIKDNTMISTIKSEAINIIEFFERYCSLSSIPLFIILKSANVKGVSLNLIKKLFAIPKIIQINEAKLKANNLLLNKKHGLKVTEIINALYKKALKKWCKKSDTFSQLPLKRYSIKNAKNKQYTAKRIILKILFLLINFLIIFPPLFDV
nr:hypothetical protein [uncultured Clostridium sp.]